MTPPGSYRNFLLGRSGASLEHRDMGEAVTQLQTLARLSVTTQAGTTARRGDTAMRLLLSGTGRAGEAITSEAEGADEAAIRAGLNVVLERARGGDRRSFYDAMRAYFVLIHRALNDEATRSQIPELLRGLRQITTEYTQFLANSSALSPEERLRYLFAASGVLRNALGRVQVDEASRNAAGAEEIESLRTLLRETYVELTGHYRRHLLAHPNGEAYTGILREIQMREAILAGNHDVARQRALELTQWLTAHPPPAEGSENDRWDHRAARALLEDPDFTALVRGIDAPSTPENTVALVNGVSLELVQTVCASIDHINEEGEAVIAARYRALSSVAGILALTRPSLNLADLLADLRNPAQADAIRQELENAAHDSAEVQRLLTEARGDVGLGTLINRAREAADHVERLRTGAGSRLLMAIFDENRRQNPVASMAESLRSHPGLLRALGLDAAQLRDEHALHRLAAELFRRGPLGVSVVEEYGAGHPDDSIQGILRQLQAEANPAQDIGELLQEVLNSYQDGLNNRPDHELAAAHAVFQLIAQTQEISEGVRVPGEVSTQARSLVNRVEGYDFRTRRVFGHLGSGSSLATLGAGIVLTELFPAALIARAGTSGRLALRGVNLVNAGRLTFAGSALTGIGAGLAMSFVGTGLHTMDRSRLGLTTHFWRDFGESAATNTVVFGATIPFSHGLARWLTPAAEDAATIGNLTLRRRVALHAGTALFGGTLTLGAGTIWRRLHTGHWSAPSYEEVAENYLSILAWEVGAAGFRRFRTRVGLGAELEGRRPFEPREYTPIENTGRFAGIRNRLNRTYAWLNNFAARRTSSALNVLFTQLGPARAARVNEVAARLVADSPQLTPLRQYLARQLALQETTAPGSLDLYTESFLRGHRIQIVGRPGSFRMHFVPSENVRVAPAGYSARLLEAMRRHHIENAASTDADYLPRFLPNSPYEIVEVRVSPETGRIVAINTHSLGDTEGAITLHCSYDPVTRQLRLPPIGGEAAPRVLDLTPMIEAHRSSPVPLLWTSELGARVLPQRLNQASRARVNQAIGDLNRDGNLSLLINADTGEILSNLMSVESLADLEGAPRNILRIGARYSGNDKTLTIPAPRGVEGEYVLDMETGRIEHRLPEREGTEAGASRAAEERPRGSERRRASRRESAPEADADDAVDAAARRITRHTVPNAHMGVLTAPAHGETGAVQVTVYFGGRSGKILGISEGHRPATGEPEHVIADNLPASGNVPRNRIALHGVHDTEAQRIVLEVPASEGQEAGTITIDLSNGRIRFEARPTPPEGPGGGTPPPSDGSPDGNPPPASGEGDGEGTPPVAATDGDDSETTAPRAVVRAADETGPQPAIDPEGDVHAPLLMAEILDPGESRAVISPNAPGRLREGQHWAMIPGVGELSAFTETGMSKHATPRNEDAYGFAVAQDGSLVAVVADGAGGSSTGDAASARAVDVILNRASDPAVSLGQAFRDAHPVILSDLQAAIEAARAERTAGRGVEIPADSYTVATALRLEPDGSVEVATVGDSQLWIARPNGDGAYDVIAPYLPASMAGLQRAARTPGVTNTVGMNAVGGGIFTRLGGSPREAAPPITGRMESGIPSGIFNNELTIPNPDGSGNRLPFVAQAGDLFLMMSDGVHTLFNRDQMASVIHGLEGAEPVRRAIQTEAAATMDLYRTLARGLAHDQRALIGSGRFAGHHIDAEGRIYDAPTGGNHVGNASPDNVVLMVLRYDPSVEGVAAEEGSH